MCLPFPLLAENTLFLTVYLYQKIYCNMASFSRYARMRDETDNILLQLQRSKCFLRLEILYERRLYASFSIYLSCPLFFVLFGKRALILQSVCTSSSVWSSQHIDYFTVLLVLLESKKYQIKHYQLFLKKKSFPWLLYVCFLINFVFPSLYIASSMR